MREDRSKESPYGPIPQDWECQPLAAVLSVVMDYRGRTPTKLGMEWGGGAIPALSAKNVCMGRVDLSRETYFGSDALYARWMTAGDPERNDVLITLEAPLGNVAWIPDERQYILSQRVVLLRPKPSMVDKTYLGYQLMSEHFQGALARNSTGTTATGIQRAKLETIPVLIPRSLGEQQRIGAAIYTINEAIEKTEAVVAKLKQVRAGLLHDLLTRGLDGHGQLRNPIAHPEQFQESPLGRIPKAWEVIRLGSCAQFVTSGSRGWASYYSDEGALFLRIGNLSREHIDLRFEDLVRVRPPAGSEGARTRVQPGDVLISITADLGIIGVIPEPFEDAYVNQHIALVRPVPAVCSRWIGRYLSFGSTAKFFRMLNDTGAKAGMNLPSIESLLLAIPSREEQDYATTILDSMDADIAEQRRPATKLQYLKSGLMADLLTGRVRMPEGVAVAP